METVRLQTESYLFESAEGTIRALPFFELSIDEWVVFQKGVPTYLIDFNRRQKPLIQDLQRKLRSGQDLETVVVSLGRFLGREWTIRQNINRIQIPNSQQVETVELILLDDLSEFAMDLYFFATDDGDMEALLDENKFIEKYPYEDENGNLNFVCAFTDNERNLGKLLVFLFGEKTQMKKLASSKARQIFDLTAYRETCMSIEEYEVKYKDWIDISQRENSMTEYGSLLCVISHIKKNMGKKNLFVICEKRKHLR